MAVEELEEGGETTAVGHGEGGVLVLRESWELVNKEKPELKDVPVQKETQ
jgi:nitrogen fixation protein